MVLPDVNVLVYAHREDTVHHAGCRDWLERLVNGDEAYGLSDLVLSGFVRVATHARVFTRPSSLPAALAIESGCEWITTDRDFSRFKGLRWRNPLQ